jgi:hypothetical protein
MLSRQPLRLAACSVAAAIAAFSQTPENFFRSGGADFRGTAPEQKLYWQPHILNSHRRILEAADIAQGKAVATVLGSGVAAEIPLAELARRFDRLVLVDMDGPSMLESLEQVPLELRSKVELRVMDVTSFATVLMEHMSEAIDASETSADAFRRYGAIFDGLTLGKPVSLPPSDLVVSSLVLSEIARYPFGYADRLMRARFDTALQSWDRFGTAFEKLVRIAIDDHVRLLVSVCRAGGVVYYSDTVARGPAYQRISPQTRAAVESAVLADFRRLGLAQSVAEVHPAVRRLCEAEHPVKTEVEAYERLLAAYRRAADSSLEPLLPVAEVQRQLEQRGFAIMGAPEAWFWLSYPCAIAETPGAFYVNSWIVRRAAAK